MYRSSVEDYLEAIFNVSQGKGYARIKDIADALNVKLPSVSKMMRKLKSKGFVSFSSYGKVKLTENGVKAAKSVIGKHEILLKLLKILSVPDEIAQRDACAMEHHLSSVTVDQLVKFVKFVEDNPVKPPKWLKHFDHFCKFGEYPCRDKE